MLVQENSLYCPIAAGSDECVERGLHTFLQVCGSKVKYGNRNIVVTDQHNYIPNA